MASINLSTVHIHTTPPRTRLSNFNGRQFNPQNKLISSPFVVLPSFKLRAASSPPISIDAESELQTLESDEKFDWYSQWYPVAPICDLDKTAPHAKRIIGIDLVVWWDRNESAWKVFDDRCPHRLAPLSEGRIDQWGRLQCVYHGWCFDGSGDCKLIPQAPPDGPPVHTFKKACVAAYPCTVQNGIVWFWPNSNPLYKNILAEKTPPYFSELDDPSFTHTMATREIPYGYEILIENLMDPAHVPYAHYKIMNADREGGKPMEMSVQTLDINGFDAKQERGMSKFIPPCIFYASPSNSSAGTEQEGQPASKTAFQKKFLLIFICIPVSPGNSRLIWAFPRNFAVWVEKIVPRWIFHIGQNLILDSDLYLLHVEEHKLMEAGPSNWQKACFLPTKSDALVVAFRKWLKKYSGGQVDWGTKFDTTLPPTPPREQLMDRYWSHVKNCRSCSSAYKALNVVEVVLQLLSFGLIGLIAATTQLAMKTAVRTSLVSLAVVCFAASKWLSYFIYKNFHYHDYSHAHV
ncbi:hypothetical protein V2J09_022746 [Rumex salicifolius]